MTGTEFINLVHLTKLEGVSMQIFGEKKVKLYLDHRQLYCAVHKRDYFIYTDACDICIRSYGIAFCHIQSNITKQEVLNTFPFQPG
jgi:hypothetical protein